MHGRSGDGRLAASAGARSRATRYLTDARTLFESLGAAPELAETRTALAEVPTAGTGGVAAVGWLPEGGEEEELLLLVDGVVGGVWHQRRSGRKLAVTVEPLQELTASQHRQLDDEVELVGAVMEAEPTLTVGRVTVGPHA